MAPAHKAKRLHPNRLPTGNALALWWGLNSGRMLILRFRGFSSFFKWLHVKVSFHQVIFHLRTFEKKSGKWRVINSLVVTKPATAVTSTDTWVHVEWKLTADHTNTPVANQKWTMKIHLMWKLAAYHANTPVANPEWMTTIHSTYVI